MYRDFDFDEYVADTVFSEPLTDSEAIVLTENSNTGIPILFRDHYVYAKYDSTLSIIVH